MPQSADGLRQELERLRARVLELESGPKQGLSQFGDFVTSAGVRLWETDSEHRLVYVSRRPEAGNYQPEELIGQTRWELAGASLDRQPWVGHLEDLAARRPIREFRYQIAGRDGTLRTVNVNGSPYYTVDGDFLGYRGLVLDETESAKAQTTVRRAEHRFADAIENIGEGIALWDADGLFVHCNRFFVSQHPAASELLVPGASYEEFVRKLADEKGRTGSISDKEIWIAKRLESFRNPGLDRIDFRLGRWVKIRKQRLEDGSTIVNYADITDIKRLEEAIRISEEKYRSLFDQGSDATVLVELESGAVVDANHSSARQLGYTATELSRSKVFDFIADLTPQQFADHVLRFGEVRGAVFETRFIRKDRSEYPVEVSGHIVVIGGQQCLQLQGRDITPRKQTEAALRQSEQRFRDFADSAADIFWETDDQHRMVFVSSKSREAGAGDVQMSQGKTRWEWVDASPDTPEWRRHVEDLSALRPFRNFRYVDAVNGERPQHLRISGRPIFDALGVFRGYRGTTINETVEIEAQRRATSIQHRFLEAVESMAEGVILWDPDLRFVMCNSAFRDAHSRLTAFLRPGAKLESILAEYAERHADLIDDASADWIEKELLLHGGPTAEAEFTSEGRNFRIRRQHLIDGSTIAFFNDITELKRRDEIIGQSQKMEAIGQLTGGIAHDFNNLLAAILGNLELLEVNLAADPANALRVKRAINSVRRGAQLTSRLLAFSRKQALEPKSTDVHGLILGMLDMLQRTLGATVNVHTDADPGLWQTLVDQSQLENALLNMAINARDAMPGGGDLYIESRNVEIDQTFADVHPYARLGPYVALSVRDTGVGIPPEIQERVFEPFFTTKGVGEGSGLGLSMVFGFVKQSDGFIELESDIGAGTDVTIFLPRTDTVPLEEKAFQDDVASFRGKGENILVIEDDQDVLETTVTMLEDLGYEVDSAEDGDKALSMLSAAHTFNLIVSDVVLPGGQSGVEIALQVRRDWPEIKVLLISGHVESALDRSRYHSEEFELLSKPFRMQDLARRVSGLLRGESVTSLETP